MTSAKLIERIMANRALFEARQVRLRGQAHMCGSGVLVRLRSGPPHPPFEETKKKPTPHRPDRVQAKKAKSEASYYETSKTYLQEL